MRACFPVGATPWSSADGADGVNLPLRCALIGAGAVMLRTLPGRCPTGCGAGAQSGG